MRRICLYCGLRRQLGGDEIYFGQYNSHSEVRAKFFLVLNIFDRDCHNLMYS